MAFATVETIQSFTENRIEEGVAVMLPADKDVYIVTSKTGSVISKKDEKTWNELMEMIDANSP